MCIITYEMIEAILTDPNIIMKGRKVVYKFKGSIKVNEKRNCNLVVSFIY
jgi:hypothetical protein